MVGLAADRDTPELERDKSDAAGGEQTVLRTCDHRELLRLLTRPTVGSECGGVVGWPADLSVSQPADLSALQDRPTGR